MVIQHTPVTVEEFEAFVALPENAERLFELIGGEVVEVPSNPYSSKIAARVLIRIGVFVEQNDLGHVTGEAGGYVVSGEKYAPDVAFISKERQPELAHEGYNPSPPDLAVEVVSPSDSRRLLGIKIANYLAAGTVVWVFESATKTVEVYAPGQPVRILDENGVLDGGSVLPGFTLAVKEIFAP